MARLVEGDKVTVERVRALGCKALGLPRPGVNIGKGVHNVDLLTPPAIGEAKPGWDCFDKRLEPEWDTPPPEETPDRYPPDRWLIDVENYETAATDDDARPGNRKLLTGPERAELAQAFAGIVVRDPPAHARARAAAVAVRLKRQGLAK